MPVSRRLIGMQDGPPEGLLDFTRCMFWDDVIHATVMGQLSLNALRWYSLTCKAMYDEVQIFYQCNYSLDPILEPFIPSEHIPAFRRLQGESGLVISGSVALQFFTRVTYPESDLDLYVEYAHAFEVGNWLERDVGCTAQNYHGKPQRFYQTYFDWTASDAQHHRFIFQRPCHTALPGSGGNAVPGDPAHSTRGNYSFKGIRAIVSFLSPVHSRKIQLIICRRNVMEVILGFHSSKPLTPSLFVI